MSEKQAPYWTVPSLEYIYLEDSYVLDVEVRIRRVVFRLDLVLTEKHADYTPPKPGEQYCYRHAQLIFEDVREVDWHMSASPPNVDPDGEVDYGNIESFTVSPERSELTGELTGEWGSMVVIGPPPHLVLE